MNILYVYRIPRDKLKSNVINKKEPDHFLYGLFYLRKLGYEIKSTDKYYKIPQVGQLFWPIEKLISSVTGIGFKLDQALILIPETRRSDLLITTTDSAGLPFLLLKKLNLIKCPIVYISTGLINELEKRKNTLLLTFYRNLLLKADVIIVHSHVERDKYSTFLKRNKRIEYIPFGIDTKFIKSKNKLHRNYILVVGKDRSRDFNLVSKVASRLKTQKFIVVTDPSNVRNINFPSNVKLYFNLSYTKIRTLYLNSKLVFIPLVELNRAAGQVSFLESIATHNQVVIAKVKGIVDVYPNLAQSKNVFLFKAGDDNEAIEKIKIALKSEFKQSKEDKIPTSKEYALKLNSVINSL